MLGLLGLLWFLAFGGLAELLGKSAKLVGRLLASLLGPLRRAGLHLVGRMLGRLSGLFRLLGGRRLLPLFLADVLGQLGRLPGDFLLLFGQLAERVVLARHFR